MHRGRSSIFKLSAGILLVLGSAGIPAFAVGDFIGFEPQYWNQKMEGTWRIDGDLFEGTKVDPHETLGLEETDKLAAGRIWLHWLKKNSLIYTTYDSRREGNKLLTSPVIFDDQAFLPGEQVKTRVQTELKSLLYGYDFLSLRLIKLGFRLGANRLGVDATLDSATTPSRASIDENVTYPVAGLGVAFEPIPMLRFLGEINGIGGHFSGNQVTFYDARIQAELYWSHFFGIITGYRRVKIDVDLEDFGAADATQKGPYAGFVLRF
jgi:hypothetical protein